MDKIIKSFTESNRYKHFIGGIIVGLLGLSVYGAIYSSIVAASCLEFKDKLTGGYWDWLDWVYTVLGGIIASVIICIIS